MIKRLHHFLVGHTYEFRSGCFSPPTSAHEFGSMKSDFMKTAGFSTLVFVCSCGSRKTVTALGKHGARANEDADLEELRRMTKL